MLLPVQRHSSFEHALMGDVGPSSLGRAVADPKHRGHVLLEAIRRASFFTVDVGRDPRSPFPDVRWVRLAGSRLWVTYGELNALADYLPDADTIDGLDRATLVPVLQRMRGTMKRQLWQQLGLRASGAQSGAAWSPISVISDAAGEVKALDSATECLCSQRYTGLLSRNACHFAPFSWQRWARFHEEARAEARVAARESSTPVPVNEIDTTANEHVRRAWLLNGYGDHFLQDSFAAGHLVNKTLVMQWFVEFLNTLSWAEMPWVRRPSSDILQAMTTAAQPGLAGRHIYGSGVGGVATASGDRESGFGPTDPQSTEERTDRSRRIAGTGLRATEVRSLRQNYATYLKFLNNSFIQGASGAVHDHFNKSGLTVENGLGTRYRVGGDNTLLTQSNDVGAMLASQAAHNSQNAILSILRGEEPAFSSDEILEAVPSKVVVQRPDTGGKPIGGERVLPLEKWHDEELRQLCFDEIFPDYEDSFTGLVIRGASSELVEEGASRDSGIAVDAADEQVERVPIGDFDVPTRSTGLA